MTNTAYISLGSNLGDRQAHLEAAITMINKTGKAKVVSASKQYSTAPLSSSSQPTYINSAAKIATNLTAQELLSVLLDIETALGRTRQEKWGSRTIDLDLLYFNDLVLESEHLTLPHLQMHLRSFVLKPLSEIAPDKLHPILKLTTTQMLKITRGGNYHNQGRPAIVYIAGNIGAGKTTLSKTLSSRLDTNLILEDYQHNPFLPFVYQGRKDLALNSELYFLDKSREQLSYGVVRQGQRYISDYMPEKSLIFPKYWLNSQEQLIFYEQFERAVVNFWTPSILIHLTCPAEICLERIKNRARKYENRISPEFLVELGKDYDKMVGKWRKSPVLEFDTAKINLKNEDNISKIADIVEYYLK